MEGGLVSPAQKLANMMKDSSPVVRLTRRTALASMEEPPVKKSRRSNGNDARSANTKEVKSRSSRSLRRNSCNTIGHGKADADVVSERLSSVKNSNTSTTKVQAPTSSNRKQRKSLAKVINYKEHQSIGDSDTDSSFSYFPTPKAVKEKKLSKKRKINGKAPNETNTMPKTARKKTSKTKVKDAESIDVGRGPTPSSSKPSTSSAKDVTKVLQPIHDDDSSSDSGGDWEEVEELPSHTAPSKDVQITLDVPGGKKKRKKFDLAAYARQLWRRHQKQQHEFVHKVELMCLLTHGQLLSAVCNEPLLKGIAMSMCEKTTLKGKQCTTANVERVLSVVKERCHLQCEPAHHYSINTTTVLDTLVDGVHDLTKLRRDEFVLLMIGVLRALGAAARLCMAWYPIPFSIAHYKRLQETVKPQATESKDSAPVSVDNKPTKKAKGKGKVQVYGAGTFENCDRQIWLEVYIVSEQRWMTVDSSGLVVDDLKLIDDNLRKPVTYIVCYDNAGRLKDLTQKYDANWMVSTRKLRVDDKWWETTVAPHLVKESEKTKQEDELILTQLEKMPFPNTIGGFKDHPLYVLARHLLKFEAIYPSAAIPLGYTKTKEPIYSRSCVHGLHSRETWLKEARQIKLGEEAYKFVKPRPRMSDIKNGIKITEATLPVYGRWQTEPFQPPTAENGKVPKNGYGNVDLFKPEMLPIGCVHIPDTAIGKLARKLGIDCGEAMIGWEIHSGNNAPQFDGWVVCKEFKSVLLAALDEHNAEVERKAEEKREKRVYGHWKTLIKGLLIRERLRKRYGDDNF